MFMWMNYLPCFQIIDTKVTLHDLGIETIMFGCWLLTQNYLYWELEISETLDIEYCYSSWYLTVNINTSSM